jgi:hypothetical protein
MKLAKLEEEMAKLAALEKQMLASPDPQTSLTEPDSRSPATSQRARFWRRRYSARANADNGHCRT